MLVFIIVLVTHWTTSFKLALFLIVLNLVNALASRGTQFVFYPHFGDLYWEPNPKACACPSSGERNACTMGPTFRWFEKSKTFWRNPPADFGSTADIVHSNNFFCPTGLKTAKLVYTLYDLSFHKPAVDTEQNRVGCLEGVFGASLRTRAYHPQHLTGQPGPLRIYPHYPRERTPSCTWPAALRRTAPCARPSGSKAFLRAGSGCALAPSSRKNQKALFEALAKMPGKTPLVLAGGRGWLMEDMARTVNELGLSSR